jgi:hypothetical protein
VKEDRGDTSLNCSQDGSIQTLSRRNFIKIKMTGTAIAGTGGWHPAWRASTPRRRRDDTEERGTLAVFQTRAAAVPDAWMRDCRG